MSGKPEPKHEEEQSTSLAKTPEDKLDKSITYHVYILFYSTLLTLQQHEASKILGCKHYQRGCKVVSVSTLNTRFFYHHHSFYTHRFEQFVVVNFLDVDGAMTKLSKTTTSTGTATTYHSLSSSSSFTEHHLMTPLLHLLILYHRHSYSSIIS